jgi:hypothetical protein
MKPSLSRLVGDFSDWQLTDLIDLVFVSTVAIGQTIGNQNVMKGRTINIWKLDTEFLHFKKEVEVELKSYIVIMKELKTTHNYTNPPTEQALWKDE